METISTDERDLIFQTLKSTGLNNVNHKCN